MIYIYISDTYNNIQQYVHTHTHGVCSGAVMYTAGCESIIPTPFTRNTLASTAKYHTAVTATCGRAASDVYGGVFVHTLLRLPGRIAVFYFWYISYFMMTSKTPQIDPQSPQSTHLGHLVPRLSCCVRLR